MQSGVEYPSFTIPRLKQETSHGLTLTLALVADGIQIFQGFVALLYLMHKSGRRALSWAPDCYFQHRFSVAAFLRPLSTWLTFTMTKLRQSMAKNVWGGCSWPVLFLLCTGDTAHRTGGATMCKAAKVAQQLMKLLPEPLLDSVSFLSVIWHLLVSQQKSILFPT